MCITYSEWEHGYESMGYAMRPDVAKKLPQSLMAHLHLHKPVYGGAMGAWERSTGKTLAHLTLVSHGQLHLIDHGERVIRMGFLPSLSTQLVQEGEDVLTILRKVLGSVVQQGEDVVGGVLRVHTALVKEVAEPLFSLHKVLLGSELDVFLIE